MIHQKTEYGDPRVHQEIRLGPAQWSRLTRAFRSLPGGESADEVILFTHSGRLVLGLPDMWFAWTELPGGQAPVVRPHAFSAPSLCDRRVESIRVQEDKSVTLSGPSRTLQAPADWTRVSSWDALCRGKPSGSVTIPAHQKELVWEVAMAEGAIRDRCGLVSSERMPDEYSFIDGPTFSVSNGHFIRYLETAGVGGDVAACSAISRDLLAAIMDFAVWMGGDGEVRLEYDFFNGGELRFGDVGVASAHVVPPTEPLFHGPPMVFWEVDGRVLSDYLMDNDSFYSFFLWTPEGGDRLRLTPRNQSAIDPGHNFLEHDYIAIPARVVGDGGVFVQSKYLEWAMSDQKLLVEVRKCDEGGVPNLVVRGRDYVDVVAPLQFGGELTYWNSQSGELE